MTKNMRAQRSTLLAVGEGDCEQAFLQHLRTLYCADRLGVAERFAMRMEKALK